MRRVPDTGEAAGANDAFSLVKWMANAAFAPIPVVFRLKTGRILTPAPFFLPRLPQGGEGRGEETNFYKHEPLAPALSPFGRGEGVVFVRCVCQVTPPNARAAFFFFSPADRAA
jgi:hypothetical protein